MNTKIKYTGILILISVLLLINGCEKEFLTLDNPNQVTTMKFWQSEGDLVQGIAATYKMLSENSDGSYYMRTNPQITEGKTENYTNSTDVVSRYEIGSYVNTMSNGVILEIFRAQYMGIFRANQVIHYAPQIKGITDELRNTIVGEAKFLRGLYYFHLVNEFGSVPITTELAKSDADYFKSKATIPEVWQQIISDWNDAEAVLPIKWPEEWTGRATKGAVIAFKGRAYLYQKDWNNAIIEYEKLVNNEATYGYALMEDYAQLWDGKHRNSKESLFEVQYSLYSPDQWGGRTATSTVYAQEVGSFKINGWEEVMPTKTLLNAMTKELTADGDFDPRAKATIAWNYPGSMYYQARFDSLFKQELDLGRDVILNMKNVNWWNKSEEVNNWQSDLNEIPMRYADVLLSLAEAYTMTGQVGKAVPLVHRIRARANLVDKQTIMNGWSQTELMTEIMHQRNVELAREYVHFFDLRRWGILEQVIKDSKELGWQNYTSKYEYYPIPEMELNANPNITQNPAWQ